MIFVTKKGYNQAVIATSVQTGNFLDLYADSPHYRYKKGEILMRPDTPPSGVYYLVEGYVKIYSLTQEGDERLHIIYKPGEVFPLIWAMDEMQKNVFYEALTTVVAKRVPREKFLRFVKTNPQALFELTKRIAAAFEIFVDRVETLEIAKSYPRLIDQMLFLAKRFGEKQGKGVVIKAPITHKDIADSIAMSRETASRDISRLEKKGLVAYKNHHLEIIDLEQLEKELQRTYSRELL